VNSGYCNWSRNTTYTAQCGQYNAPNYYYPQQQQPHVPYYVTTAIHDPRVTVLEGEVKVLREMLAALLSGRTVACQNRPDDE